MEVQRLEEYADSRGVKANVDRAAGVIRGVKILGLESSNGRRYSKETIAAAIAKYDGAKVNVDHPKGDARGARGYADRIGVIRNPSLGEGSSGLYADFHFNPKHALAEQLLWDAEHAPENVGFSHVIEASCVPRSKPLAVEEIVRVISVDLVSDPATTRGLFEASDTGNNIDIHDPEKEGETSMGLEGVTVEALTNERPDLVKAIAEQAVATDVNSKKSKTAIAEKDDKIKELTEQHTELDKKLDEYKAKEALAEKRAAIETELAEAKLPEEVVTDTFRNTLLEAKDAEARKVLIVDRQAMAKLTSGTKPHSRDQRSVDGDSAVNAEQFVEAIT